MNLTNLLIKSFCLCPLICSFLTLQIYFIRFSMNVYSDFRRLVGSSLESLSNVPRTYMQCIEALRFDPCATFVAWWAQVDSNHRPRAYQARALTTWAMSPFSFSMCLSSTLAYRYFYRWWRWWESNPWPPACRAGALPAELHPHFMRFYSFWVPYGHSKLNNNRFVLAQSFAYSSHRL